METYCIACKRPVTSDDTYEFGQKPVILVNPLTQVYEANPHYLRVFLCRTDRNRINMLNKQVIKHTGARPLPHELLESLLKFRKKHPLDIGPPRIREYKNPDDATFCNSCGERKSLPENKYIGELECMNPNCPGRIIPERI